MGVAREGAAKGVVYTRAHCLHFRRMWRAARGIPRDVSLLLLLLLRLLWPTGAAAARSLRRIQFKHPRLRRLGAWGPGNRTFLTFPFLIVKAVVMSPPMDLLLPR